MKQILIFLFLLISFTACKTREIVVKEIEYKDRVSHDTLKTHQLDSVYVYQKGDTIYKLKQSVKTVYKSIYIKDTIYKKIPEIYKQIVNNPVYVEKKLNFWQKFNQLSGKVFNTILLFAILYFSIKYMFKSKIFIKILAAIKK